MQIYHYTVLFEPNGQGGYTVTCPALPGVITEGDTLEQAREMAKDSITCWIESLQKDGLLVPTEDKPTPATLQERIAVQLATV